MVSSLHVQLQQKLQLFCWISDFICFCIRFLDLFKKERKKAMEYEEALSILSSMFSSWDPETLGTILESNGGHMERTIDVILKMENGDDKDSIAPPLVSSSLKKKNVLPDDFLRLPGTRNNIIESEQERSDRLLAQMLQDEMFQQELAQVDEFAHVYRENDGNEGDESGRVFENRNRTASETAQDAFNSFSTKFGKMSEGRCVCVIEIEKDALITAVDFNSHETESHELVSIVSESKW